MNLQPNDYILIGEWIFDAQFMHGDEVCNRIEWLISNSLIRIASSSQWGDWETLFKDPTDGRYWERTYPQSDRHGGGPPQIRVIGIIEAKKKYSI